MKFVIDTSDERNKIVMQKLFEKNFVVQSFCETKKFGKNDYLIFSPAKKWTNEEILNLPASVKLFCGNVDNCFLKIFEEKHITFVNLLKDEKFAIKNANLTAEGVLALILQNSKKSIFENNILIFGFGRIAKACSVLFLKLGLKFKIATFNPKNFEESFFVGQNNFFGFDFLKELKNFDVVINTRPEKFLNSSHLKNISKHTLFLETASINCLNESDASHFFYLKAPALPQKFSCESAAQIVLDKILGELNT